MQNAETWQEKQKRNIYRRGNIKQNQQRRVQTTQLYYNAAEKYKHPIPADTGTRLKYDIRELRLRPERLTKAFQEQEQEAKTPQEAKNGRNIKKTLGKLPEKTYPRSKKATMAEEPDWALKLKEWGTNK